ncbi:LysR family transcriptional regulator [Pseudonocardia sp. NPDC049154]|uniref:LysR family transcriptional regulator n=1 Tax=Pseudonocardia sp. NPDC049154 TaxID=3155501 RepID=UPI00340CA189
MNVEDLEWFVALAETPHMTQAAERLNTTQPTLSRSLARLEHEVGAPLFDRVNRRLRLNPSGEVLLRHTRRCLLELRAATEHIRALRDPEHGTVRLGFLHSVATWLAPELIRGFRARAPQVQFALTQAATYELEALVADGIVDLAVTGPRPADEDLAWHTIHTEQLCLVVPRDHRLADRGRVGIAEAAGEPFVMLGPDFGLRRLTDDLLARAGVEPETAFESAEIATMESLAAAGLGVTVVPRPRPHRADPNAVYLPLTDDAAHRVLGLVWRADQPESPVVRRFRAFVVAEEWTAL